MKRSRSSHDTHDLKNDPERPVRRRLVNRRHGRRHRHAVAAGAPPGAPVHLEVRIRPGDDLPFAPSAYIFDVEGTLVDSVLPTLQCWNETLAEIGVRAGIADLHAFSGTDSRQMLRQLTKKHDAKLIDHIDGLQAERYRRNYLPRIRPVAGVRQLFTMIKDRGAKIALAASCDADELAHYRGLLNVDDLVDAVCGGDAAAREKSPRADVVHLAAARLHLPHAQIIVIGDTPHDAQSAAAAGLTAVGVQSGHFSRSDLTDAGCAAVFFDLQALRLKLQEAAADEAAPEVSEPAASADPRSRIGAAADSR